MFSSYNLRKHNYCLQPACNVLRYLGHIAHNNMERLMVTGTVEGKKRPKPKRWFNQITQ